METYFTVGQVKPKALVGFLLMKIVPKHLNEIKEYKNLDYLAFREKLLEIFEEPDVDCVPECIRNGNSRSGGNYLRVHASGSTSGTEGALEPRALSTRRHSNYEFHAWSS